MTRLSRFRFRPLIVATVVLSFLCSGSIVLYSTFARAGEPPQVLLDKDDEPKKKKVGKKKKRSKKKGAKKKGSKKKRSKKKVIRWGQRRNETDEQYDKRFARILKRVRQDKKGDYRGGRFENGEGEEVRLWTHMGHHGCPFICRSDIDSEFTANLAMYMEMLHREFGAAYKKILAGITADVKEPVEIIVFADKGTYFKNGGKPGSGGQFNTAAHIVGSDRGNSWPARHWRMMQFTDGITDFAKWPKSVLKHESCHMELHLRLGYTKKAGVGFPVIPPVWWNEGQAGVFEWWDFDKTVDENFAEIANRGRYAPFVRRMYGTDNWKGFDELWTIDHGTWGAEGRVFLNYAQSWSIVAYMFTGGVNGRRDFRRIFDLSRRVGTNRRDVSWADQQVRQSRAWLETFPQEAQDKMAANWKKWVSDNVSRDKRVPDEAYYLRRGGYDPEIPDRLAPFQTKEDMEENRKWVEKEEERRKKKKGIER